MQHLLATVSRLIGPWESAVARALLLWRAGLLTRRQRRGWARAQRRARARIQAAHRRYGFAQGVLALAEPTLLPLSALRAGIGGPGGTVLGPDIAARSFTGSASPFAATAVLGGGDYTGAVRFAGGVPWFDVTHPSFAGGAKGDGKADDTAAIQAAINAAVKVGSGIISFPPGTYAIKTGPLLIGNVSNLAFWAPSDWSASLLLPAIGGSTTQSLFSNSGATPAINGLVFQGLDFQINYPTGSWSMVNIGTGTMTSWRIFRCRFRGQAYSGAIPFMFNIAGTAAGSISDIKFEDCRFENNTGAQCNGLIVRGFNGMLVERCTFVNINNPIVPDNIFQKVNLRYVNNEEIYTENTYPSEGPDIMGTQGVVYMGNQQRSTVAQGDNDVGGVLVDTHAGLITSGWEMVGNHFETNSIQFAPQNGAAITDFAASANSVNGTRTTTGVNSGIVMGADAGTSARIVIDDTTITGSFTGNPINVGSGYAAGAIRIAGTMGADSQLAPSVITVGASPFTYTNPDPFDEDVYISTGTVSRVDVFVGGAGAQVYNATNVCVRLKPGERTDVYYSVAPTMIKVKHG